VSNRLRIKTWILTAGLASVLAGWVETRAEESVIEPLLSIEALAYDDGWGNPFRNPSALFVDRISGELFVSDGGNGRVVIFDLELGHKFSLPHFVTDDLTGGRKRGEPRDLVVTADGEIILIDNLADYLDVLDFRGNLLERIHLDRLLGDTTLSLKPVSLAIDHDQTLYVATGGDVVTVMVLSSSFELIRTIGQGGSGPEDFNTLLDIAVWNEKLFTTDLYAEPAIKIFDISGEFRSGFGGHDVDRGGLSFPAGITIVESVLSEPLIWVVDGLRQVIKVFDMEGKVVSFVGGYGAGPGEFRYPADLTQASDSVIFLLERVGGRVQKLRVTNPVNSR